MGARSGFALKFLQWFIRGIQFCCCALVLSIYSYFLAALSNHDITIPTWVRAVEGISGVGVLYTLLGLLLLCCLAGHPFTAFVAMVLDVAFIGGFIYVATANKGGASSCSGSVSTPFGTGDAEDTPTSNKDGFTKLPSYRTACKMESACLAVSIVAIIFFIVSILVELVLVRHRRKEQRFGPSPANDYTSGYAPRRRFFGLFRRKHAPVDTEDPNKLPAHTSPDEVRPSYNTEATAVNHEQTSYNKYGDSGYGHEGRTAYPEHQANGNQHASAHYPPGNYRYGDGTYAA